MALKDHCLSHVAPKALLPHDVLMLAIVYTAYNTCDAIVS